MVTLAQFDSDNLRIARPSEVLGNIKVLFCNICVYSIIRAVFNGKTSNFDQSQLQIVPIIQSTNQNSKQIRVAGVKRGKTCMSRSHVVPSLLLIGLESLARFLYQPLSV